MKMQVIDHGVLSQFATKCHIYALNPTLMQCPGELIKTLDKATDLVDSMANRVGLPAMPGTLRRLTELGEPSENSLELAPNNCPKNTHSGSVGLIQLVDFRPNSDDGNRFHQIQVP